MSEIKVGDEVLVNGVILNADHGGKFCMAGFGSKQYFTVVLKSECQKIEPKPFLITPQDVGRIALTRNKNKAFISHRYQYNADIYAGILLNEDCASHWNAQGMEDEGRIDEDLVAWWDE